MKAYFDQHVIDEMIEKFGTQTEAARGLGFKKQYINSIMSGRLGVGKNIAKKLGYTRAWVKIKEAGE